MYNKIGICGKGFVGGALTYSFDKLGISYCVYDKYKEVGSFDNLLTTDILFLCLPSLYLEETKGYDIKAIIETCHQLNLQNYKGLVVIKSTVTTGTSEDLSNKNSNLSIVHNPEFLTARTANEDFHNQTHIVLGKTSGCEEQQFNNLYNFYQTNYPIAEISKTTSSVSESMKAFCNTFYSVKIGFFNELFFYCQEKKIDFNQVKDLMLKNGWINKMHTNVPGPDGKFGFGGACFPKDTNALLADMEKLKVPSKILSSVVKENIENREKNN